MGKNHLGRKHTGHSCHSQSFCALFRRARNLFHRNCFGGFKNSSNGSTGTDFPELANQTQMNTISQQDKAMSSCLSPMQHAMETTLGNSPGLSQKDIVRSPDSARKESGAVLQCLENYTAPPKACEDTFLQQYSTELHKKKSCEAVALLSTSFGPAIGLSEQNQIHLHASGAE